MRAYKEWRKQSACLDGEAQTAFRNQSRKAKNFCLNCPVKRDCLNYALLYDEDGIWGGTTEIDRARILKANPLIQDLLKIEALQLGIFEHRYTIDQYWESIREARKLQLNTHQAAVSHSSLAALAPSVAEFQALLVEWNIQ